MPMKRLDYFDRDFLRLRRRPVRPTTAPQGDPRPGHLPLSGWLRAALLSILVLALGGAAAAGQEARIRDLTVAGGDVPVRLVGYGLVVGLDGTGDRVVGGFSAGHTVRSVANLLRRFNIEVPENMLRTRNVAAVLVTAETSPYLRPGGRFEVHVASVGDAVSLRGGVLWMTPLQSGPNAPPVATAQGALLVSAGSQTGNYPVETTAVLPEGGLLERPLPRPDFAASAVLYLREPDIATAYRIAQAVNGALGDSTAAVEDPGSVTLRLDSIADRASTLTRIGDLKVVRGRPARVIIDGRSGSVVAGGNIRVGEAVVSHGAMTLTIGGDTVPADSAASSSVPGDLRLKPGVTIQDIAVALHGVAAPPEAIAAVFEALRQVGAISAEVAVR